MAHGLRLIPVASPRVIRLVRLEPLVPLLSVTALARVGLAPTKVAVGRVFTLKPAVGDTANLTSLSACNAVDVPNLGPMEKQRSGRLSLQLSLRQP